MAKIPAKNINFTINAIALEDDASDIALNITQETPVVTGLDNVGPRRLVGNYDFDEDMSFFLDFAAGQSDATMFAGIGSAGVATTFDPTGGAAGANDPNYDASSMVLGSYSISGAVGGAVTGKAKWLGNSALTRAVA